ncbi:MAG: VWA domain-containing protein, partial [Bryobacteraceae bacterium]
MLHVEVNLVQVDAEVTDAKGKPVTNLTAADFELRQDGKPQTITNFSYIDTSAGAGVAPRAPRVKGAPALPPVDLRPADVRRTFVVVVDDLGVAWENLPAIKHALRKFVEQEKQPTDLVAIISTGGGMGIFQQFTTDPKQLLSAVDHLKFNPIFNRVGISSFPSINPLRMPSNPIRGFVSRQQSAMSIGSILRVLRNMPGRKILLLFSEEMSMISGDTFVQQLGDQAIRASVAIYTVDPRGLPTLQLTAADEFALLGKAGIQIAAVEGRHIVPGGEDCFAVREQDGNRAARVQIAEAHIQLDCVGGERPIPAVEQLHHTVGGQFELLHRSRFRSNRAGSA